MILPFSLRSGYYLVGFTFLVQVLIGQSTVPEGCWAGDLFIEPYDIPIGIHFKDSITAFFDNPAQGSKDVKFDSISIKGDSIELWLSNIHFQLVQKSGSLEGTSKQSDKTNSVKVVKGQILRSPLRPQTPHPPFPYFSDTVNFKNHYSSNTLEGTLTRPKNGSRDLAAILLTGSGPQNRDEEILGHRIFAVIADFLTRQGVAVLRFDDRGVGGSTGTYATATSYDFATDAASAYAYLDSLSFEKIGFIGHSEGGIISPIADSLVNGADFHIFLAAPGLPIWALMVEQNRQVMKDKLSEPVLGEFLNVVKESFLLIKSNKPFAEKQSSINQITGEFYRSLDPEIAKELSPSDITFSMQFSQLLYLKWWTYFLSFEPKQYLAQISAPILALNGSEDIQVTPDNLPAIKKYTAKSISVNTIEIEGVNHLFQNCISCSLREYGLLTESFSPEVLEIMINWLKDQFFAD